MEANIHYPTEGILSLTNVFKLGTVFELRSCDISLDEISLLVSFSTV